MSTVSQRQVLVVLSTTIAFAFAEVTALASSTGPVAGSSGVPAAGPNPAENTCVMCHTDFPLNPDEQGKIQLLGVPDSYVAGKSYELEVRVSHPEAQRWGFQLTAVAGPDLHGSGIFMSLPNDKTTQVVTGLVAGRTYVEHGTVGKATGVGQKGSFGWKFTWTAPATSDGAVKFYGAFNAANGDGNNSGDKIYTPASGLLATTSPKN